MNQANTTKEAPTGLFSTTPTRSELIEALDELDRVEAIFFVSVTALHGINSDKEDSEVSAVIEVLQRLQDDMTAARLTVTNAVMRDRVLNAIEEQAKAGRQ